MACVAETNSELKYLPKSSRNGTHQVMQGKIIHMNNEIYVIPFPIFFSNQTKRYFQIYWELNQNNEKCFFLEPYEKIDVYLLSKSPNYSQILCRFKPTY